MFKTFTRLDYLLKEAFIGLKRGGWMNWAAISTVTVLLFLFGISLQATWQVERLVNQFGNQLEVSVFLESGIAGDSLQAIVQQMPEVADVQVISKEEAWANLVKELGLADIRSATEQLNGNPLVDQLKVKARSVGVVASLSKRLAELRGVNTVQYVDEVLQRLAQLNQGLSWVSLMVITLLTLAAVAVITTTIRLIVLARRREIEIMQLVGATTTWIYLPFLVQGVAFGVAGGAIAWVMILTLQQFLASLLAQQPDFIRFLFTSNDPIRFSQVILLPLILLTFGGGIGLLGSLFAVYRLAPRS